MKPLAIPSRVFCFHRIPQEGPVQYCLAKLLQDDLIRIPGGDIVWHQIFINMKLIDIHEEVDQSNVTMEELLEVIYDSVDSIPTFRIPVTNGNVLINVRKDKIKIDGQIELVIYFHPTEPECNENMFREPLEYFIKKLLIRIEDTVKRTDPSILSGINISLDTYIMYYKEGIINFTIRNYLDRSDIVSILSNITLLDALTNLDLSLSDHVIPVDRLPKFEPGYSLAMDKAIKRIKTIYTAYQKGTFKDKPYDIGKLYLITITQTTESWDPNTRTIYPNFHLVANKGEVTYDGDQTELIKILTKKFGHFGITFN